MPQAKDGMLLIITCTYSGMPPENTKGLATWLDGSEAAKQLKGVNFSVFGIGNSQWRATYQKFLRKVDEKTSKSGAARLVDFMPADTDGGQVDLALTRWSLAVVIALFRQVGIPLPASLADQLYEKITPLDTFVRE